jgi:two-component system sensor histidine kinase QseC
MRSIRSRTLLLVLGLLAVALSAISYVSYRDARHEIEELFDAVLAQQARLLAGMIPADMAPDARLALQQALDGAVLGTGAPGGDEADDEKARPLGHEYESKLGFVVLDDAGNSLLQSASAPVGALERLLAALPRTAEAGGSSGALASVGARLAGYHTVQMPDGDWRLFVLQDTRDRQWILVGERQDVRGELVGKITLRSLLPDLVGLPLVGLLVWLAIGWGLRPLRHMVRRLKRRDPDKLSPLEVGDVPQELEPMVASLNRLLLQVTALLERERRFLAYAAHELRTPLAVLRIHAQNALQAPDPADRDGALRQLEAGIDRATRVVAQLLTLARLEPDAGSRHMAQIDLLALARQELAELTPLALEHGQELALEAGEAEEDSAGEAGSAGGRDDGGDTGDEASNGTKGSRGGRDRGGADFRLVADAPGLGILLQNLVSNAVQHTPPGGRIRVVLEADTEAVVLRVQDSGPGVAPELRGKVFERFFRAGGGSGAGLGLSIVARIVELHHGTITLGDSPFGGLEVWVRLPRAGGEASVGVAPGTAND